MRKLPTVGVPGDYSNMANWEDLDTICVNCGHRFGTHQGGNPGYCCDYQCTHGNDPEEGRCPGFSKRIHPRDQPNLALRKVREGVLDR